MRRWQNDHAFWKKKKDILNDKAEFCRLSRYLKETTKFVIDSNKSNDLFSFNLATGELLLPLTDISDDALIGHSLLCSIGSVYNCTDRLDTVRLVDKHGFIQSDGFYNYLTAWYNEDHMM